MKSKFFHPIKTRVRLEAVLSSIFAFIGIFAKFSYILVKNDASEYAVSTMFGYRYLSQFLWALGNEAFTLSIGVFIWVSTMFAKERSLLKVFRGVSLLCIASSLYFMGWIFFAPFYSDYMEVLAAILFSVAGTLLFSMFLINLNRIISGIQELTDYFTFKIRLLTNCLILVTPDYVRNKEVYFEEIVEPTLDKLNE